MKKMRIMKDSWVYDVWKESSKDNVLATNQKFDVHQLSIFYKVRVTSTGLSRKERNEVKEAVNREGGHYDGEYNTDSIDIVIAKRNATETAKLKAALNQHKDCLCFEWILDSIEKGCALPFDSYRIDLQAKKHTSTPEKSRNGHNSTHSSVLDISNVNFVGTINDTAMSNLSISSAAGSSGRKCKSAEMNENQDLSYKAAFDKLNVQDAKKASTFLDGCNVSRSLSP